MYLTSTVIPADIISPINVKPVFTMTDIVKISTKLSYKPTNFSEQTLDIYFFPTQNQPQTDINSQTRNIIYAGTNQNNLVLYVQNGKLTFCYDGLNSLIGISVNMSDITKSASGWYHITAVFKGY